MVSSKIYWKVCANRNILKLSFRPSGHGLIKTILIHGRPRSVEYGHRLNAVERGRRRWICFGLKTLSNNLSKIDRVFLGAFLERVEHFLFYQLLIAKYFLQVALLCPNSHKQLFLFDFLENRIFENSPNHRMRCPNGHAGVIMGLGQCEVVRIYFRVNLDLVFFACGQRYTLKSYCPTD